MKFTCDCIVRLSFVGLLGVLAAPGCGSDNPPAGSPADSGRGGSEASTGAGGATRAGDASALGGSATDGETPFEAGNRAGDDASVIPADSGTDADAGETGAPGSGGAGGGGGAEPDGAVAGSSGAGGSDAGTLGSGGSDAGTLGSGGSMQAASTPADAAPDSASLTGTATLSFVVKFGEKVQFPAGWAISIPGYDGDSTIVFMLCNTTDPTCRQPVLLRAVANAEKENKIIQFSWGPKVTLNGLPAGSYKLMVFADSSTSRARGYGWDQSFSTKELDWGGKASEADLMLNDSSDPPASGHNPAAKARDITLVNGQTLDLGDLFLSHYHQRDISPDPQKENGIIAVATDSGLRVVNLNDLGVKAAYTSGATKYYDYVMQDDQGDAFDGSVCGMVRGPGATAFLLFRGAATGAGFAVQFNPVSGQQVSTKRVLFPGTPSDTPCRGYYHEQQGQKYLWVTNAVGPSAALEGVWYANVSGLVSADVTAGVVTQTDDMFFRDGVDQIAALGDTVYFASNSSQTPCGGKSCAFKATFDSAGKPAMKKSGATYEALVGPGLADAVTTASGDVSCVTSPGYAGMAIARFHDGKDLLFLGECLEITMFDLATGSKLDFNGPGAGKPGLDATLFGQGFVSFSLSPDGKVLWAVSNDKSLIHFNLQKGVSGNRQTYNRWMLLPIDLTTGDLPSISADYNTQNLDGYEGTTTTGVYSTPAIDPGVDVDFAYLKQYIIRWAPDLAGGTPTAIPVGPTIAAANHTVWLRGSQVGGSGLANQGNVAVFALPDAKVVLWPRGTKPFYEVWTGGTDTKWGYDLTPENDNSVGTHGVLYFALP